MKRLPRIKCLAVLVAPMLFLLLSGCGKNESKVVTDPHNTDPNRCMVTDIGEASDFNLSAETMDDRMVVAQGIANPQALVWRDQALNKTFYLTRIMATERKLYYMRTVPDDEEKPGIATEFKGHLIRWSRLDPKRSIPIAQALHQKYNITVNPKETYLIIEGEKPKGCP